VGIKTYLFEVRLFSVFHAGRVPDQVAAVDQGLAGITLNP
jgi:hypothetical protein